MSVEKVKQGVNKTWIKYEKIGYMFRTLRIC